MYSKSALGQPKEPKPLQAYLSKHSASTSPGYHQMKPLWLCLYWPMLPLVVFQTPEPHRSNEATPLTTSAKAVYEQVNQKNRICYANHAARQAGISIGMSSGSANSLCASLNTRLRDPERELKHLNSLATKLEQLTPYVHVDAEHLCIYLEISTCLKLHKGFLGFEYQLQQKIGMWANRALKAYAPSAECSAVFARHHPGDASYWTQPCVFWQMWYQLPIEGLLLTTQIKQDLNDCGFKTLSDIVHIGREASPNHAPNQAPLLTKEQLPAFKRRFGADFISYWHQLCGQQDTLKHALAPPLQFNQALSLPFEAQQLNAIMPAIKTLLIQLELFLIEHCMSVLNFIIQFKNTHHNISQTSIRLTHPHHRAHFFQELAQLHLEKLRFSAPIIEVSLRADQFVTQNNTPLNLFNSAQPEEALSTLLTRLKARIGQPAIMQLVPTEDYRPENICSLRPIPNNTPLEDVVRTKNKQTTGLKKTQTVSAGSLGLQYKTALQPTWLIDPLPITDINAAINTSKTPQGFKRLLKIQLPKTTQNAQASYDNHRAQLPQRLAFNAPIFSNYYKGHTTGSQVGGTTHLPSGPITSRNPPATVCIGYFKIS